jgi:hypothetical protein
LAYCICALTTIPPRSIPVAGIGVDRDRKGVFIVKGSFFDPLLPFGRVPPQRPLLRCNSRSFFRVVWQVVGLYSGRSLSKFI